MRVIRKVLAVILVIPVFAVVICGWLIGAGVNLVLGELWGDK